MTAWRRAALQAALWGGYVAVSLAMARAYMPLSSAVVVVLSLVGAGLWTATEALRALALRGRWLDMRPPALVARLLPVPVPAAIAVQAAVAGVTHALVDTGLLRFPPGSPPLTWAVWWGYVANTAILLWLWLGAWASAQYLRRWRDGQVARWQAEAARSALELQVLRAQVNPHFLFNALNNLRALILEDPHRARDAVTRLSNTLRHTLDHGARDTVSLAEELAVVRDYVALEQLQLEGRLRVRWDVAPGLDDEPVPPMVLQLLVENAIKHGISQLPGGGEVGVRVGREGSRLRIAVTNPGRWAPGPRQGLGLAHLRERLARAGGPGADCRIDEADGRVCVEIRLGTHAPATASSVMPATAVTA